MCTHATHWHAHWHAHVCGHGSRTNLRCPVPSLQPFVGGFGIPKLRSSESSGELVEHIHTWTSSHTYRILTSRLHPEARFSLTGSGRASSGLPSTSIREPRVWVMLCPGVCDDYFWPLADSIAWVWIPTTFAPTNSTTLAMIYNAFWPQFPHLKNGLTVVPSS